jgi:hypothetical protein
MGQWSAYYFSSTFCCDKKTLNLKKGNDMFVLVTTQGNADPPADV